MVPTPLSGMTPNLTSGGSGFIARLEPPVDLAGYDRTRPFDQQPHDVPRIFLEAMSIREAVFVHEQGVPLPDETDADDPISIHFVGYASVRRRTPHHGPIPGIGTSTIPIPSPPAAASGLTAARPSDAAAAAALASPLLPPAPPPPRRSIGTLAGPPPAPAAPAADAATLPVATLRLVLPVRGAPRRAPGNPTDFPLGEPFVKFTRLAVRAEFRGLGLARLIVTDAVRWATEHPEVISPPLTARERDAYNSTGRVPERWMGLLLVHAQEQVQGMWERLGFRRDVGMGEWMEDGCLHVGMWKRVMPMKEWEDSGFRRR